MQRSPDQRLLTGAPATLRAVLADQDGEADDSIDGDVTVTVSRLDGTAVATAQSASCTNGEATYSLTAAQTGAGLDLLTCAWSHGGVVRATTYAEIVGRHWFPASSLREIEGVSEALATAPGDATDQALIWARTVIETIIEWATGVAWVPRCTVENLDARGDTAIWLRHWYPRTLRALTIDGTAEDLDDWALTDYGALVRVDGGSVTTTTPQGLVVQYDHGADAPPPPLVRAAKQAAAHELLERISKMSSRLTGASFATGTISFAAIDRDHPTGLIDVDGTILNYRQQRFGA